MVSSAPPGGTPGPGAPPPPPPQWPTPPGRPPAAPYPPRRPQGGGGGVVVVIAAVVVSVVMVIGILAAIAIPSFIKYQRRAESSEATFSLSRIVYAATAYWDADRDGERDEGGELVASRLRRFPDSVDWTPRMPPCEGGGHRYEPDEKDWEHSTWKALAFAMTTRHRYRYRFTSRGQGDSATFTVEAEGDLNCNGLRSHYQRVGRVKDGKVVVDPVQSENPLD